MSAGGAAVSGPKNRAAPDSPEEELWRSLLEAYHAVRLRQTVLLTRFSLSVSEYHVLRLCSRAPAMASEIAHAIGITPAGATDLIDRLEERHLVVRASHPEDRRALLIRLTPAGEQLFREARAAEQAIPRAIHGMMTDAERRGLALGLAALNRALTGDSV